MLKHLLSDIFSAVFMDWATVKDVFLGAATPEDVAQAGVFSERELFFEAHAYVRADRLSPPQGRNVLGRLTTTRGGGVPSPLDPDFIALKHEVHKRNY